MPTVYSASSTQWPILQSKTEQKFKSGLFNVSAEFIRPVGNTNLPTQIETSIGPVNVWPEPTVSVGTNGFERINATGYGLWDNITDISINRSVSLVQLYASYQDLCTNPNGCGTGVTCGDYKPIVEFNDTLRVIVESAYIKKTYITPTPDPDNENANIYQQIPLPPVLKIYRIDGTNLPEAGFSPYIVLPNNITEENYYGYFGNQDIPQSTFLSTYKINNYGAVVEIEAVYEIAIGILSYGNHTEKYPVGGIPFCS